VLCKACVPCRTLLGYRNIGAGKPQELDPHTAPVRQVFELYSTAGVQLRSTANGNPTPPNLRRFNEITDSRLVGKGRWQRVVTEKKRMLLARSSHRRLHPSACSKLVKLSDFTNGSIFGYLRRLMRLDGLHGHLGLQAGWMTLTGFGH